jgi:hydroxymethylbilane synthase
MKKTPFIRIGTRNSKLALWQAESVQKLLSQNGVHGVIVPISSTGDQNLTSPIYKIGITGVFTKELDTALLNEEIDIAVHSHKDVPTELAEGLEIFAVPFRHETLDVFVPSDSGKSLDSDNFLLATGSLRRQAQWLNKYPHHQITDFRGNIQTRLQKLKEGNFDGAIFAKAGLQRMNLLPESAVDLDWMLSAPGQGAVMIVGKSIDVNWKAMIHKINDEEAAICTSIEKEFLKQLEGGCSAPIGAWARIVNNELLFNGNIVSTDGSHKVEVAFKGELSEADDLGKRMADQIKEKGGKEILETIKLRNE